MASFRITVALLFAGVVSIAFAQDPGKPGQRASTPPGTSQDGSRPADGAIQGGSIAPRKTGGAFDTLPPITAEEQVNRCNELKGTLREQCLGDFAATGGTSRTPPPASSGTR